MDFNKCLYRLFGSEDVDLRAVADKPNDPQPEKKKVVSIKLDC
jgi:hypothetical protein